MLADGFVFVSEGTGEFEAADGVDAHFERGNAEETPFGVGERLDEFALVVADGRVVFDELSNVSFIEDGIVAGEQNGPAGEPGLDGVQGGFGFTGLGCGAGAEL